MSALIRINTKRAMLNLVRRSKNLKLHARLFCMKQPSANFCQDSFSLKEYFMTSITTTNITTRVEDDMAHDRVVLYGVDWGKKRSPWRPTRVLSHGCLLCHRVGGVRCLVFRNGRISEVSWDQQSNWLLCANVSLCPRFTFSDETIAPYFVFIARTFVVVLRPGWRSPGVLIHEIHYN